MSKVTINPPDEPNTLPTASTVDSSTAEGQAIDRTMAEVSLSHIFNVYIDHQVSMNFTLQAKGALASEGEQYLHDLCEMSEIRRKADRNAEVVLENHVKDAAAFIRAKKDSAKSVLADWSKWIGFTFLGFTIQQWNSVRHQKPIIPSSVSLLVLDAVVTAILIVTGFKIDKPFVFLSGTLRKMRNPSVYDSKRSG
jgi:hypothetical protein